MKRQFKLLFRTPRFMIGFVILALILGFIAIYPLFDTDDPLDMISLSFRKPGTTAMNGKVMYLGSDNFGRDVLLNLVYGTRTSLYVGLVGGLTMTAIGLTLGLTAGYLGGVVDNIITSITNCFIVIPSFVILILISVSLTTRSSTITSIIVGLTGWPWMARAVRAQTTSLRRRDHVNIARITGYGTARIILTEILPYVASYVMMAFILAIANCILQEASLAMLGLGPSNTISLGTLMNWALLYTAPSTQRSTVFVPCSLVISLITFSLYMMNSGMDEVFNPKIRR